MEMMGDDEHDNPTDRANPEPTGLTRVGPSGESSSGGALTRGREGALPHAVERHMIVEKKAVSAGNGNLSRHLLSITAAVNAYVVEKGSLVLAIYGSQPGEGTSTV